MNVFSLEDFAELFYEKYYNEMVRQAKADGFMGLTQGNLSLTSYTLKFDHLAKLSNDLVSMDAVSMERFVTGLRAHLACDVHITLPQRTSTYVQVVERALIAESLENQIRQEYHERLQKISSLSCRFR